MIYYQQTSAFKPELLVHIPVRTIVKFPAGCAIPVSCILRVVTVPINYMSSGCSCICTNLFLVREKLWWNVKSTKNYQKTLLYWFIYASFWSYHPVTTIFINPVEVIIMVSISVNTSSIYQTTFFDIWTQFFGENGCCFTTGN